jgi:2-polyprenyl-3-methyl-5-hydroxy-6-metoxy-1,4-benzoquinol methylase
MGQIFGSLIKKTMDELEYEKCKICNSKAEKIFNAIILNKYKVSYLKCSYCNFIFTEKPYWLEESYKLPINIGDTGELNRNINSSLITSIIVLLFFNKNKSFLDYAAGHGLFVRRMRDIGFNFFWFDPFTENKFAKGFEKVLNSKEKYELVTAFECLEHIENPISTIEKILLDTENILFSTNIVPEPTPNPQSWWYYGLDHGQHISLYSKKSMQILAENFGLNYYTKNNYHLFTKRKINNFIFKLSIYLISKLPKILSLPGMTSKIESDHLLLTKNEYH